MSLCPVRMRRCRARCGARYHPRHARGRSAVSPFGGGARPCPLPRGGPSRRTPARVLAQAQPGFRLTSTAPCSALPGRRTPPAAASSTPQRVQRDERAPAWACPRTRNRRTRAQRGAPARGPAAPFRAQASIATECPRRGCSRHARPLRVPPSAPGARSVPCFRSAGGPAAYRSAGDIDAVGLDDILLAVIPNSIAPGDPPGAAYVVMAVDLPHLDAADGRTDGEILRSYVVREGLWLHLDGGIASIESGSRMES